MAYIAPDSTIILCKNIPFNSNYDDTILFGDSNGWDFDAQFEYFLNNKFKIVEKTKYSVVREQEGKIRVDGDAYQYQGVNYMVFTNKNFTNRHFYAFVTKVEFINPATTFLYFTIDVMQSYFPYVKIGASLIEREHVEDDSLYANLEDEGIPVGERLTYNNPVYFDKYVGDKLLVLGTTVNPTDFQGYAIPLSQIELRFPYILGEGYEATEIDGVQWVNGGGESPVYIPALKAIRIPLEVNSFTFKLSPVISRTNASYEKEGYMICTCTYNELKGDYEFTYYWRANDGGV